MIFDLFFFVLAFFMSIPLVGAWYASSRGRDFWTWYFVGLLLPVISFVILLCLPDRKNPLEKELQQIRIQNKMLGLKNEVPDNNATFLKWLKKSINIIHFNIEEDGGHEKRILIQINDNPLVDLLQEEERTTKSLFKKKSYLGDYRGLAPDLILPPSKHLMGKPEIIFSKRTVIMQERETGRMILVKVEVLRKHIIWHEFIKADDSKQVKSYSKIGPFVFDRWQYELALNDVAYRYKKIV